MLRFTENIPALNRPLRPNSTGAISVAPGKTVTLTTGALAGGVIHKLGTGTLQLAAAGGTAVPWSVNNGVLEILSTAGANPLGNNATLNGGTLRITNTSAADYSAGNSGGTFNFNGGGMVYLDPQSDNLAQLSVGSLVRNNQGTFLLGVSPVGNLAGAAASGIRSRVIATNVLGAPAASANFNGILSPSMLRLGDGLTSGDANFLSYGANGLETGTPTTPVTTLTGLQPAAVATITTPQTLTGNNSIYALKTTADITGGSLQVVANNATTQLGGILLNGAGLAAPTVSSNLFFGLDGQNVTLLNGLHYGEGLVYTSGGYSTGTPTLSGTVTANNFTKSGFGPLLLSGTNRISGFIAAQSGSIQFAGAGAQPAHNTLQLNDAATLDLAGGTVKLGALSGTAGVVTNTSAMPGTLNLLSPGDYTFTGNLRDGAGSVRVFKGGTGILRLGQNSGNNPVANVNTHTGGFALFAGQLFLNTPYALGANNSTFEFLGGLLTLNMTGAGPGLPTIIGSPGATSGGVNMVVKGTSTALGTDNNGVFSTGFQDQYYQFNNLTLGGSIFTTTPQTDAQNLRFAGTITGHNAAVFNVTTGGTAAGRSVVDLSGTIVDAASNAFAVNKTGSGTLRISGTANTYTGGTNVFSGGAIQITSTTGTPVGTGPVTVYPGGFLRLGGSGSLSGASSVRVLSSISAYGAVVLDNNFQPTLSATAMNSFLGGAVQIGMPTFAGNLDMSQIGDGRQFLGTYASNNLSTNGSQFIGTLQPGAENRYRVGANTNAGHQLYFSGPDNVFTGAGTTLEVGSPIPTVTYAQNVPTNSTGIVVIQNSNNYTGGTLVNRGSQLYVSAGGATTASTPLGTGPVEIRDSAALLYLGPLGSAFNNGAQNNVHRLRILGEIGLDNNNGLYTGAGGQGRWGDAAGITLDGGRFRLRGGPNFDIYEKIGTVNLGLGHGYLTLNRVNSGTAVLEVEDIVRGSDRGTLLLESTAAGTLNAATAFERLLVKTPTFANAGATNTGAGATAGIAPVWMLDNTSNTFLSYQGPTLGLQPLLSTATPQAGQVAFSHIISGAFTTGLNAGTATVDVTANSALGDSPSIYALRLGTMALTTANAAAVTANTVSGSNLLTNTNTTNLVVGQPVSGTGIAAGTVITRIVDGTSFEISNAVGLTQTGASVTPQFVLNVTSGGVIANNTSEITHNAPIRNPGGEVILFRPNVAGITIFNGPITATGITKAGLGDVRMNMDNRGTLTGDIVVSGDNWFRLENQYVAGGDPANPYAPTNKVISNGARLHSATALSFLGTEVVVNQDTRFGWNFATLGKLTVNGPTNNTFNTPTVIGNLSNGGFFVAGATTLNGPTSIFTANGSDGWLQGGLTGTGALQKWGDGALQIGGDSSSYSQPITVNRGTLMSMNGSTLKPFGTGPITVNPGSGIGITAPSNVNPGQLTINTDGSGVGVLNMQYVGALPSVTWNSSLSTADGVIAIDVVGYSTPLNLATASPNGRLFLGAGAFNQGASYTAPTLGVGANNTYRIGGGGGQFWINSPVLTGTASVQAGVYTAGPQAQGIAPDRGGTSILLLNTPNSFTGGLTLNSGTLLEVNHENALGTGPLIFNGGSLRSTDQGLVRMTQVMNIPNEVVLLGNADFQNRGTNANLILSGPVRLSSSAYGTAEGAARTIFQNNPVNRVILSGTVSDGTGTTFNHLLKNGAGVLELRGTNTYTGITQVDLGTLLIGSDGAIPVGSQVLMNNTGLLAVWDRNYTLNNDVTFNSITAGFSVGTARVLTQSVSSNIAGLTLNKIGDGTLRLQGNNSFSLMNITGGVVEVSANANLGDTQLGGGNAITFNSPSAMMPYTGVLRVTESFTTQRALTIAASTTGGSTGGTVDIATGKTLILNGPVQSSTASTFGISKTGNGTLLLNGASTWSAANASSPAFSVTQGTVVIPAAAGLSTSANANTALNGGTLALITPSTAAVTFGNASNNRFFAQGGGRIQLAPFAGGQSTLNALALTRPAGSNGTLVLDVGAGFTLGSNAANGVRVIPTNLFNEGLARASSLVNGIYAPVFVGNSGGVPFFLANDATHGLVPYAGATATSFGSATATSINDFTTAQNLAATATTYAIRTNADITAAPGALLRVSSVGAALAGGQGGLLTYGTPTLSAPMLFDPTGAAGNGNSGEGVLYTGGTTTLSGTVLANSLTVFGGGTTVLAGNTVVLGGHQALGLNVQQGTLQVGSTAAVHPMNTAVNLNLGANLDLNGNTFAVGVLNGAFNNSGGTVGNSSTTAGGTLLVNGQLNSTFTGRIVDALGAGTRTTALVKAGPGTLTLAAPRADSPEASNNTFTGGTSLYQGTLKLENPFALGGFNSATQPVLNLYGGVLQLNADAGSVNGVAQFGSQTGPGLTLNVLGSAVINVDRLGASLQVPTTGNMIQVGDLNLTSQTLSIGSSGVPSLPLTGSTNAFVTTNGSNLVTGLNSTAGLYVGMPVTNANVPAGTTIAAINSNSSITLSQNATGGTAGTLSFGNSSIGVAGVLQPSSFGNVTTVANSPTVTVPSTAGFYVGMAVSGTNIPSNTVVTAITNSTTLTLSQNATAPSSTGVLNTLAATSFFSAVTTRVNDTLVTLPSNATTAGYYVGMPISGANIPFGSIVTEVGGGGSANNIRISNFATATSTTGAIFPGQSNAGYGLRIAGTTSVPSTFAILNLLGAGGASGGRMELAGPITGSGNLVRTGLGFSENYRNLVISGTNNTGFTGGLDIQSGVVQITGTSGSPLGDAKVRVYPQATLRLAGNGSLNNPANLTVLGTTNTVPYVLLDGDFNPTVLNATNFSSAFGQVLGLGRVMWNTPLNMATIGDGRAFLVSGVGDSYYLAPTLGVGADNTYRIAGGSSTLVFAGADNVLTGTARVQIGNERNNWQGGVVGFTNIVTLRNSNNYSGGTQVTRGITLNIETGAAPGGGTPLGTGPVEIFGTVALSNDPQGYNGQASFFNAATGQNANTFILRPGGRLLIRDMVGSVTIAGGQGRWADATGLDLNGGEFRFDGGDRMQSVETVGDLTISKGSSVTVARTNTGSATLNTGTLIRSGNGTLSLASNSANRMGIPNDSNTNQFDRFTVNANSLPRGGTTVNGLGVVNGGMAPVWIVDATSNSYVGYDALGQRTGFQPLLSTGAPVVGTLEYNRRLTSAGTFTAGLTAGTDIVDISGGAQTFAAADNPIIYALRTNQNLVSPGGAGNTLTLASGGMLFYGNPPTVNPVQASGTTALAAGNTAPMTLNFGANEAVLFTAANTTATVNAQITQTAGGLTKFGTGALVLNGSNTLSGNITLNQGETRLINPVSGSGTPINSVTNGRTIVLNGVTLTLDALVAAPSGRDWQMPHPVRVTGYSDSDILLNADSFIGNFDVNRNATGFQQRFNNLTFADLGPNSAARLDSSGNITVGGTTTLSPFTSVVRVSYFNNGQNIFEGPVVGSGKLVKIGTAVLGLSSPNNTFGTDNQISLEVYPAERGDNAGSTVASLTRTGTPFGVGDVRLLPGSNLRLADPSNISATQKVLALSDGLGLSAVGFAFNVTQSQLANLLATTPTDGKVAFSTTGAQLGGINLDAGWQYSPLDLGALETQLGGGKLWLGSTHFTRYVAPSLAPGADGVYRFGSGGNQGGLALGNFIVANQLTGPNRVVIGANVADNGPLSQGMINSQTGNGAAFYFLNRNNYTGGTLFNAGTGVTVNNNFAFGSGTLTFAQNGNVSSIRPDFGAVNNTGYIRVDGNLFNVDLMNPVELLGDIRFRGDTNNRNLNLRGPVNLSPGGIPGTRTLSAGNEGAGSPILAIQGVISGVPGSNVIKNGNTALLLTGNNTFQGSTEIVDGQLMVGGDVFPNVAGPLGVSNTPLAITGSSGATALILAGNVNFGRDATVTAGANAYVLAQTGYRAEFSGGLSIGTSGGVASANTFTVLRSFARSANQAPSSNLIGALDVTGPITGPGALRIGDNTLFNNVPDNGVVRLLNSVHGFGTSTFTGGLELQNGRLVLGADTLWTGTASAPVILSGAMGTGALAFGTGGSDGNNDRVGALGSNGLNLTLPYLLNGAQLTTDRNLTVTFEGRGNLNFNRTGYSFDLGAGTTAGSARQRNLNVTTQQGLVTLAANLVTTGSIGAIPTKQGQGILVYTGSNNAGVINSSAASNQFLSWRLEAGSLVVANDAALGNNLTIGAVTRQSDVQLAGGTLSVNGTFTTDHQYLLAANSTLNVTQGNTFTLRGQNTGANATTAQALQGAFTLTKTGLGTLALNPVVTGSTSGALNFTGSSANTGLTLGGFNPGAVSSATVSNQLNAVTTTNVSGTPFLAAAAGNVITLNGGLLGLTGSTAQTITHTGPVVLGGGGYVSITRPTTGTNALTALTFNAAVNKGTLVVMGTDTTTAGAFGTATGTQKFVLSGTLPTVTNGTLATPNIVLRNLAANSDANFASVIATHGFQLHSATTTTSLGASAATSIADLSTATTIGAASVADAFDVYALRTSANLDGTDSTDVLRVNNGGLILNGSTAPVLGGTTPFTLRFGTSAAATDAYVHVREGQAGTATIAADVQALDFIKFGAGNLLLSGTSNVMAPTTAGLRTLFVQEGLLRFGSAGAVPTGGANTTNGVNLMVNDTGALDLNGLSLAFGGLTGTGFATNTAAGAGTLVLNTGLSASPVFSGVLQDGAGSLALVKDGIGTQTISTPLTIGNGVGQNAYTGGTTVRAGQVLSATPQALSTVSSLGTLVVNNPLGLGTGPVTLAGGTLTFGNSVNVEVVAGQAAQQFGSGNGYDITVAALNNFGQPNVTSILSGPTANAAAALNNLNVQSSAVTLAGGAVAIVNHGILIKGTTTFNQATSYLSVSASSPGTLAGPVVAGGGTGTLHKLGDGVLVLAANGQAASNVGNWVVNRGMLELRGARGMNNLLGAGATLTLNDSSLNFRYDGDGQYLSEVIDTHLSNNLVIGSTAPVTSDQFQGSRNSVIDYRGLLGITSFLNNVGPGVKTVAMGNLTFGGPLGSPILTLNGDLGRGIGNYNAQFSGITLTRDGYLSPTIEMTVSGPVTGNGTLYKQNSNNLYLNGDSSATLPGGFVQNGGTTFLGARSGGLYTPSETAKLTSGNILIQPGTAIQFNSTGNIPANWTGFLDVRSHALNYGILRIATDAPLSAFNFRVPTLGGPQDSANYVYSTGQGFDGIGRSMGAVALNLASVYTQNLDMARIGDGMAFLGSSNDGLRTEGVYNGTTLGAGAGNRYRLGGSGGTLYFGTNGASNVLTGTASLEAGTPFNGTIIDSISTGSARGTTVLLQNQNYTGATIVNRVAGLDFRGSLASSSFETWGRLIAGGLGGTFVNSAQTANLGPVTLRPGGELWLDYSTGLLPVGQTEETGGQGRWLNSAPITLDSTWLRLYGNRTMDLQETVGTVTVRGGSQLFVQRDIGGRIAALRMGGLVQATDVGGISGNNGTLNFRPAAADANGNAQLGSDERVMLTGGVAAVPGGITNGMVAPWMVDMQSLQFLTYLPNNGFVHAGYNRSLAASTISTNGMVAPTDRTRVTGSLTINNNTTLETYALRLDDNVSIAAQTPGSASNATLQIWSGGLILNPQNTSSSLRISPNRLVVGDGVNPADFYVWANRVGTVFLGDSSSTANAQNAGQLVNARNLIFTGGQADNPISILELQADQQTFTGNVIVNAGNLVLRTAQTAGSFKPAGGLNVGTGARSMVVLNNPGYGTSGLPTGILSLRAGGSVTFENGLVIGQNNYYARISTDRDGSSATNANITLNGPLRFLGSPGEQGQSIYFQNGNDFDLAFSGVTDLGPDANQVHLLVESTNATHIVRLDGKVTSTGLNRSAALFKDGGGILDLANTAAGPNDFKGGITMTGGELRIRAVSGTIGSGTPFAPVLHGGIGEGPLRLYGGTTRIRIDGSDASVFGYDRISPGSAVGGNSLIVNGPSTLTLQRLTNMGTSTTFTMTGSSNSITGLGNFAFPGTAGTAGGVNISLYVGMPVTHPNLPAGTVITAINSDSSITLSQNATASLTGSPTSAPIIFGDPTRGVAASNNSSNKLVTFKDLTIGSHVFTWSGDNTYALDIAGPVKLVGNPRFDFAGRAVFNGPMDDNGANLRFDKLGSADLWLNNTNANFGGGVLITNAGNNGYGHLRFGSSLGGTNYDANTSLTATAGTGRVRINPNAGIVLESHLNVAGTGQLQMVSAPSNYSMLIVRRPYPELNQAYFNRVLTADSEGVLALANDQVYFEPLNMAAIGNGRFFLAATNGTGGVGAHAWYAAPTLQPGAGNVYRLGGGFGLFRLDTGFNGDANNGYLTETGVLTGTASVLIGAQGILGNGGVELYDLNTYTGGTTVNRRSGLYFAKGAKAGAGPLGVGGAVDVFGYLEAFTRRNNQGAVVDNGTFLANGSTTANAYTVNLHPGARLHLQNNNFTASATMVNRWGDTTPINLNSNIFTLTGPQADGNLTSAEVVGAINLTGGGNEIDLFQQAGNRQVALQADSLNRAGNATLVLRTSGAGFLGLAPANNSARFTLTSAPTVTNGMLPGWVVSHTDNQYVTTGANGLVPAGWDVTVSSATFGTATTATQKVDLTASSTLQSDVSVYALRTGANNITSAAGQYNTITFGGSGANIGGLLFSGNSTINANLRFGATGTNEALIYTGSNITGQVSGDISASAITLFGAGIFQVNKDQTEAARGTGNGLTAPWFLNQGQLNLQTFGAAGTGPITLGGGSGNNSLTPGLGVNMLNGVENNAATLVLQANPGSVLSTPYSFGLVTIKDQGRVYVNLQGDDRTVRISDVAVDSTDTTGQVPARARFEIINVRSMLTAGNLTLTGSGGSIVDVMRVQTDGNINAGGQALGINGTTGLSTGVSFASLNNGGNAQRGLQKWGNGYMFIRGDSSATFNGPVRIEQGPIQVNHDGALGTGPITVARYGVLDINKAGWTMTNSGLTYSAGSAERWSIDGARNNQTLNLGAATLQINSDQFNATGVTVRLNGGGVEGWLRGDDLIDGNSGALFRTVGSGVTFALDGNSTIGQNLTEGGQYGGIDTGRIVTADNAIGTSARGIILDVRGAITGTGSLTKQGYDMVILAGANTYSGGTNVTQGILRIGRTNALNTSGDLFTTSTAVLDMNGFNQMVRNLSSSSANTAGITSGFITNSATNQVTLTAGNNSTTDSTYHGVIQNNVALAKTGSRKLTLTANQTYLGSTTIAQGTLELGNGGASGSLPAGSAVINSGTLMVNRSDAYTLTNTVSGTGGVTQAGLGTLTLAATNTFSGPLTAAGGTLAFASGSNLGDGSATNSLNLNGGTVTSTVASLNLGNNRAVNVGSFGGTVQVDTARQLEFSGQIGGSGTLNKTGAGTLVMSNMANGFTGTANVNDGTLSLTGSLGSASAVNVNNGGTLLLNNSNRISDSAGLGLGGGQVRFGTGISGAAETMGALTLNFDSVIDLGTGSANQLKFSSIVIGPSFNSLKIYNYTAGVGEQFLSDPNRDRLVFAGLLGLNAGQLSQIQFFSDSGSTLLGPAGQIAFGLPGEVELAPVPEPSTWMAGGLLLGLLGYRERRRLRKALAL